jgi:hypothetical protein
MAPYPEFAAFQHAHQAVHTHHLARRDLSVNSTQATTLGVIAVYVVVIALLWNIPYVRNVLWPFKVGSTITPSFETSFRNQQVLDAHHRIP